MTDHDDQLQCPTCGGAHEVEACDAMRAAADAGAHPQGVPLRVYGGYLEARTALRMNAPASAVRVLQWLLAHLAEERGARPQQSLAEKVNALCDQGVISPRMRSAVVDRALEPDQSTETAWALMSLAEHALARLYLKTNAPIHG